MYKRGEGKIDSPVQISYLGATGGKRVQISSGHRRTRSLLHPLPVMHDAMLLTLYAHRNNPIFLPRFHLRLVVPPCHPRGPCLALSLSRRPALGYLFPFISTIGSRTYILRPRRALLRQADLAVYFITARNDFASPPCELLGSAVVCGDWIHAIVIDK